MNGTFRVLLYFTAGNAEIVKIWKTSSQVALILLHTLFCVGGVISPLVMAPFLMEKKNNSSHIAPYSYSDLSVNTSVFRKNVSILLHKTYRLKYSFDLNHSQHDMLLSSKIHVPYSISSVFCFVISISFLVSYFFPYEENNDKVPQVINDINKRKIDLPRNLKITAFMIMFPMATLSGGINSGFVALLSPFCVEFLDWRKSDGSRVTSVVFILVVIGGLLGVALSKCLQVEVYTGIQCSMMAGAFVVLLISINIGSFTGVWIAAAVYGFAKSVLMPLILAWTNDKYFTVSGKVASVFYVGISAASAINPFFLGFIMENFSMKWFCYLFIAESIAVLMMYIASVFLTRFIENHQKDVGDEINIEEK